MRRPEAVWASPTQARNNENVAPMVTPQLMHRPFRVALGMSPIIYRNNHACGVYLFNRGIAAGVAQNISSFKGNVIMPGKYLMAASPRQSSSW